MSWLISYTDTVFSWNWVMLLGSKNHLLLFGLHPCFPYPIEVLYAVQYVQCTRNSMQCFLLLIWLNKILKVEASVADLSLYSHMWLCHLVTMTGMLLWYKQQGMLVCCNQKDFSVMRRMSYTKGVHVGFEQPVKCRILFLQKRAHWNVCQPKTWRQYDIILG